MSLAYVLLFDGLGDHGESNAQFSSCCLISLWRSGEARLLTPCAKGGKISRTKDPFSADGRRLVKQYKQLAHETMDHPSNTLSALLLAGGVAGYLKKGSIPSLAAGLTFSVAYGTAGYLLRKNADWGLELALGSSVLLLAAGIARGVPTRFKKPIPLVLTVLGALGTGYYTKKYNEFYPFF